ncbi:MAG: hypothetical protein Q4G59_08460 [Planctomycetia bacterium]|nr:hypothetical protein [Planctomycetia bacterium]
MKKPRGWKKLREKKNKQWLTDHNKWLAYQKANAIVTVSDITEEGFWVHTPSKDYYPKRDKCFKNATDEEIRDVHITLDVRNKPEGDYLDWRTLDIQMHTNYIEKQP